MLDADPAARDAKREAGSSYEADPQPDRNTPSPDTRHLVIPKADAFTIRRVAGVINALASKFDMLSRRQDLSLRSMSLSLQDAVSTANSEIRRVTANAKARRTR